MTTCIGGDPLCPCQDGDACHYRDAGKTKGFPMPASDQQVPQPVTDDEVATFIHTMGGQFARIIAEIWHTHPDFGIRQTLDELNRRFPAPQPEPVAWQVMADGEPHREFGSLDSAQLWADDERSRGAPYAFTFRALYASPPPQPERRRGRRAAAEATVTALGYTYHGGELWKPPLGPVPQPEPVAWRDHVEQRIRTWRCSRMNEDGDVLKIDDFMGDADVDDLVDFVCDEYAAPPLPEPLTDAKVTELRSQNGWAKETIRAIERAIREIKP